MNMKKEKRKTSPNGFDKIVREVFAPIYPAIAKQILEKTNLVEGKCLDAGCGTGALGRALAKYSKMELIFFDKSQDMLELTKKYVKEEKLEKRSSFLLGDIHKIPYEDESLDLIISRGSNPFWEDWEQAYKEIYRVLKKGGKTYIGCGFGSKKLYDEVMEKMEEENPNWKHPEFEDLQTKKESLPKIMQQLKPSKFEIIDNESGFWLFMEK
jgi:ubiquinone/menaquinone biosynthesis C-methylase UbiE